MSGQCLRLKGQIYYYKMKITNQLRCNVDTWQPGRQYHTLPCPTGTPNLPVEQAHSCTSLETKYLK